MNTVKSGKNSGLDGIRAHYFYDAGAELYSMKNIKEETRVKHTGCYQT